MQDRQSLRLRPVHGLQAKEVHTAGQSRNVELLLMAALLFTLHGSPYLPSEHVVETDRYLLPFGHRVAKSGLLPGWIREGAQELHLFGRPAAHCDRFRQRRRAAYVHLLETVGERVGVRKISVTVPVGLWAAGRAFALNECKAGPGVGLRHVALHVKPAVFGFTGCSPFKDHILVLNRGIKLCQVDRKSGLGIFVLGNFFLFGRSLLSGRGRKNILVVISIKVC